MAVELFVWVSNRFRPREGWLPLLLIASTVGCLVAAVEEVGWVPKDGVVIVAAALGLFMGVLLAYTTLPTWRAWIYLTLYGLLIPTLVVARLFPPFAVLLGGWADTAAYWRQQGALFVERVAGWLATITAGQSSSETIVFALFLGLAAWFVVVYVAWTVFRQRRPITGLALMGVALAINGYYGNAPIYWSALFVGLAAMTAATTHFVNLEHRWQRTDIDYSTEIKAELLLYAGAAGMALLALSWSIPAINVAEISQAFIRQPAVAEAEAVLSRAFAGVPQPRRDETAAPGVRGILPRSFLVGEAPELLDTIVMTATVNCSADSSRGIEGCQPASALQGYHWRAGSYDIYTGRGWSFSPEREEMVESGEVIQDQLAAPGVGEQGSGGAEESLQSPIPIPQSAILLTQQVQWVLDDRQIRYTIGYPTRFDQPVIVSWRGPNDFSRARGLANSPTTYEAESWISQATAAQLRQSRLEDVPPALLARYTDLPDTIPERVRSLAEELTTPHSPLSTQYDQAQAIEQFLRQYTYTLDVELPPAGSDVVDYFLFDAQQGYCDYYASAMVVLARSVGLPARLATGFLAQPTDEDGVQTIRQINGHSWAEVYFAGYGWIEFEPTAPFASSHAATSGAASGANEPVDDSGSPFPPPDNLISPPPIPERAPQRTIPRPLILLLLLLVALLWWRWGRAWWRNWRERPRNLDSVEQAYLHLQESAAGLGRLPKPSETPAEFSGGLLAHLERTSNGQSDVAALQLPIARLTELFIAHQYAREPALSSNEAIELWRQLRRPLFLARLRQLFSSANRYNTPIR
jgi:transglutaminase-like putative cysteine protease